MFEREKKENHQKWIKLVQVLLQVLHIGSLKWMDKPLCLLKKHNQFLPTKMFESHKFGSLEQIKAYGKVCFRVYVWFLQYEYLSLSHSDMVT